MNLERAQRVWDTVMFAMVALAFLGFVLACVSPWIAMAWRALWW